MTNQTSAWPSAMPVDSPRTFAAALHWAVQLSVQQQARDMCWVAPDFTQWPLDDASLLELLTPWLKEPRRRLRLLAANYEGTAAQHPRFMAWFRVWAHAVEARQAQDDDALDLPTLAWSDAGVLVQINEPVLWRGHAVLDRPLAYQCHERIDAVLQRSTVGLTASALGL